MGRGHGLPGAGVVPFTPVFPGTVNFRGTVVFRAVGRAGGVRGVDGDRRHLDGRHRTAGGNGGNPGDRIRGQ